MSKSVFFIGHPRRGKTTASVEFIKRELLTTPSIKKLFVVTHHNRQANHIRECYGNSLEARLRATSGFFAKIKYIGFDSLEKYNAEDKGDKVFLFPFINWDDPILQAHIEEMYCPSNDPANVDPHRARPKEGDLYVFELTITNNVYIHV